jgi:hypothetical protein
LNPNLLQDAIREATSVARKNALDHSQYRILIHSIYNRKTKEFASLYPVIFSLENSIRSSLADYLADYFKRMDWWVIIRDDYLNGRDHNNFVNSTINGKITTIDFIKQIFFTIENILKVNQSRILGVNKTDEFYYCLTIGDLTRIMMTDWSNIRNMFRSDGVIGFKLDLHNFKTHMHLIRDARNALYHSNPISNRKAVFEASERILNALDFHLGDLDEDIGNVKYSRINATIERAERHHIPAR